MRSGGELYPKDLESELHLPHRTVDHDLKLGVQIGIFKQKKKKGPYAWIDYEPEEEIIRKVLKDWLPLFMERALIDMKKGRSCGLMEFIEEFFIKLAAIRVGKDPQDKAFRKLAYKVVNEFFSKPEKFLPAEMVKRLTEAVSKRLEESLRSDSLQQAY